MYSSIGNCPVGSTHNLRVADDSDTGRRPVDSARKANHSRAAAVGHHEGVHRANTRDHTGRAFTSTIWAFFVQVDYFRFARDRQVSADRWL